jgi:NADH-quinone oxidoreductase subunit M
VFWGPGNTGEDSGTAHLHDDLGPREIAVMLPIVVLIFWMGVHPQTFLAQSEAQVGQMLTQMRVPQPRGLALAQEVKP